LPMPRTKHTKPKTIKELEYTSRIFMTVSLLQDTIPAWRLVF